MALQPASGARDLNPQQVEHNQLLRERLADVYRQWGYDEVSPPQVERMDTLKAGGGINSTDIVRLVADEPLGLRPEMTASIARAATTRLAQRVRPLRLWSSGTVFESCINDEGGQRIEEKLYSGVELFGCGEVHGELELLSLLMASFQALELQPNHQARLLVGHAALMELMLAPFEAPEREAIKQSLVTFDRLDLEAINISHEQRDRLLKQLDLRGEPNAVIELLRRQFGPQPVLTELERLFNHLQGRASELGVTLQLDPSFQPHFELYDGLVFQLVCQGDSAPVVVARGGRYDSVLKRFGADGSDAAGLGFGICLDDIRDLPSAPHPDRNDADRILVAYGVHSSLEAALQEQRQLHKTGTSAVVELSPLPSQKDAEALCSERGCSSVHWVSA